MFDHTLRLLLTPDISLHVTVMSNTHDRASSHLVPTLVGVYLLARNSFSRVSSVCTLSYEKMTIFTFYSSIVLIILRHSVLLSVDVGVVSLSS